MSQINSDECFLLHQRSYGETSIIVEAFTKNHGKMSLIAKGAKKPKSKRGRYLPKSVRDKMTPSQKAASNRKKRKAGGVGSRAKYSKKVRKAVRRAK